MNEKLGIPYMGSKRKLAPNILKCITQRHPNLTDFYDLFGGGGSISFTAIRDYRFNVWCYEQVCLAEMFKLPNVISKLAYSTCYTLARIINNKT